MSIKGATILIPSKIQAMLKDYAEDLEQAWTNAGEDPLTISFSVKIGVTKGKNLCEVSISFTEKKVKDSVTFEWSANQGELFKTIEGIDYRLNEEGISMTISSPGGESVTLGKKEADLPDLDEGNKFYNGKAGTEQSATEE
jgi:hypothetical protein